MTGCFTDEAGGVKSNHNHIFFGHAWNRNDHRIVAEMGILLSLFYRISISHHTMGSNDLWLDTFYGINCKRSVSITHCYNNRENDLFKKKTLKIKYNPCDWSARVIDDILSFGDGCFLLRDNVIQSLLGNMGRFIFLIQSKGIDNRFFLFANTQPL